MGLHDLAQRNIDFGVLYEIAIRHKVEQLLYRTLELKVPDLFPADYLVPLRERCEKIFARNLALADHLVTILEQLTSHGIAAIPYKGPVLTAQIYGDLSLRRFFDLDLLVHPEQYSLAGEVFQSYGYTLMAESGPAWECNLVNRAMNPPLNVDLHKSIMPSRFFVPFDFDRLRERLIPLPLFGERTVPTLSPDDLLLVLCAHASKPADRWNKLRYICDIAELLRTHGKDMNWSGIFETGREIDAYRMTLLGIHLSHALLDAELPAEVSRQGKLSWLPALKNHVIEAQLKKTTMNERNEIYAHPEFYLRIRESVVRKPSTFLFLCKRALNRASATRIKDLESIQFPKFLYPVYFIAFPLQVLRRLMSRVCGFVGRNNRNPS
jgi:hypothetical protein